MIRNRMGVVTMGAGGNASSYKFDPSTGLSNDPQLAYYLQDLTPAQLQTALDGLSPSTDLNTVLYQDITGTGAGSLPCGSPGGTDPTCSGGKPTGLGTIPTWAWFAGAGLFALALLKR